MEIERTAVWADIRKIFSDGAKPVRYEYRATLHTERENIPVMKLITLDTVRDYVGNIGDEVFVEIIMSFGDYVRRLYPYRANLEITIYRQELYEAGSAFHENSIVENIRYKAIFLAKENQHVSGSEFNMIDKASLDLLNVQTVKFQLMDRALEPLRIKTTGGSFQNVTQADIIHALLLGESNRVLIDGKPAVDGMNFIKPDNNELRRHVVIPDGTLLPMVPTYCQEKMNGVYTAGMGTYLQSYQNKRLWFVYPLFNPKRFDENVRKVIFYSVPRNRFPSVERTYRQAGDITYIAATSNKAYRDGAEAEFMEGGSGFRMTDARPFMKKPVTMTDAGPVASRTQLNHEVAVKARKDDLNFAPISTHGISGNPFVQYSKVLQRAGGRVDLTWENSNPGLIHPGMPCKFVFVDEQGIKEQRGVILFIHSVAQQESKGIASRAHRTISQLTLYVEPMNSQEK